MTIEKLVKDHTMDFSWAPNVSGDRQIAEAMHAAYDLGLAHGAEK